MMKEKTIQIDIISAEGFLFSDRCKYIKITGAEGVLGIYSGHSHLLSKLVPGYVNVIFEGGRKEEYFYVSGGFLEVQPDIVNVLSDTVVRANDIDEAAVVKAKKRAEEVLNRTVNLSEGERASVELAESLAKLKILRMLKEKGISRGKF